MASVTYAVILLGLCARICDCSQSDAHDWRLSVTKYPWGDILEGSDVTFTCTIVSSNPDLFVWIEWQHLLSEETTTLTEPTYVTGSDTLTLTGVSGNQAGSYQCAGSNSLSPAYWNPTTFSGWGRLSLIYRPVIMNKDRTWIGANNNYTTTLECIIRSDPRPAVTWYGPNGANITEDTDPDRVSLGEYLYYDSSFGFRFHNKLTINPVNSSTDYGMYRCRASNGIGTFVDHEIELKETGPPEAPKDLKISNDGALTEDTIVFNWEPGYDGGEELESYYMNIRGIPGDFNASNWIQLGPKERYWAYTDLQPDTLYQITGYARNILGPSPNTTLDVRTTPTSPSDLGITVSYTKSKGRIIVTGIPRADKDNRACLRLAGRDLENVFDVSLRPDLDCIQSAGEFEYFADGPYFDNMRCYLCRDKLCGRHSYVAYVWELFVTKTPSGTVLEGDDVTLTCAFDSGLSGWIEWRYSLDREISTTLTEPMFTTDSNDLTFKGVFRNQSGWYRCAGNSMWSDDWNPNRLSDWTVNVVFYGPEISNKDRTWIGANDNYKSTLECIIQGNPLPNVTWYGPNDTIITTDTLPDRISLEDTISGDGVFGYQVISQVVFAAVESSTDYGMYRCRAASSIGTFDEHEIQLKETGNPEPPKELQPWYVTDSRISVQWESGYDGGEELENFFSNIRKIPDVFDPLDWISSRPDYNMITYRDLQPDTLYQVAVYATNKHGSSPYATLTVRTNPGSPDEMGTTVSYIQAQGKFVITGIPEDEDAGTCLRLEVYDEAQGEWVSLRPDLDCIQHGGEFLYSSPYPTDHFHCLYCRDDVCGYSSHVTIVTPTPQPTRPTGDANSNQVVIIAVCVAGTIILLLVTIAMCYICKCCSGKPQDEVRRTAPQPNTTVEVYNPSYDPPPTYVQAVELEANAGKNNDDPPPAYDCVPSHEAPKVTDENEEQV
ncbi:Down syndrome cell adhesion molecule homolog [Patiria miniata]|uniref:Uncharacterized protein n=1 Tax=Patiria miniata TaxID=46514 RepID=A0A914AMG0_PATMI|nr:Down syndrome cell adhesion molecule homolog [Patiria miniata]